MTMPKHSASPGAVQVPPRHAGLRLSHCAVAAAATLMCGVASAEGVAFKFSGFGTLSAVHSNDSNSDFVANISQPSGAGHTSAWSFAPDSKLGGQIDALFTDKFSGVLQVVSQHQYDNSYTPQVEWANLKYQVSPEFSVRLGRIAAPSYVVSESRFVGYANTWVRPPAEVYSVMPITSNDGIDATYRSQIAGANNSLQAFYGVSTINVSDKGKGKSKASWGINDTVEVGSLTLRAGYNSFKLDFDITALEGLVNGLQQFAAGAGSVPVPAFQSTAAQARALAAKYPIKGFTLTALALGATYDPGNWFATAEFIAMQGEGFITDANCWFVSGGYRFGNFTPYLSYAKADPKLEQEAGIVGAPPPLAAGAAGLTGGVNAVLRNLNPVQTTSSVGLRWDFARNVALKSQFDHTRMGENSNGRFIAAAGQTAAKSVNLVTVALDFVF